MKNNIIKIMISILILIAVFMLIILVVGKKEETSKTNTKELENTLLEYAKDIFREETWENQTIPEAMYIISLKTITEMNRFDISKFKNCNQEETKIQVDVSKNEQGIKEYKYAPFIKCN